MWLYFNKNGQLLETLEHGNLPRAGTTDFEIFAFFEGVNVLSDYTTATLKLIKPDLNETEYPNLLMSLTEKRFSKLENENSNKFIDGNKYVGFYFAFSDFSDTQTIEVLLDTIGTWKAIITLFKNGKSLNVAGTATFTVASGIENEEGNTVSIDTLFNMCYSELSKFLPKKSDSYFKIVENASEIQIFDSSLFNVNDIIFDRTTKLYYKLKYNDDFEIILGEKIILNYSGTVEIVDNLDSDSADKPLSARQGNVLKNLINDVQTELETELETSYRKKEEQDKIDKKKTNTYIVSCLRHEPTRDSYGKGWTLSDMDGNSFATYDEFIEYVGDAIYSNGLLNSVEDSISLYDGRNHYLVTEDDYKIILITNRIWDVLKKGDIIAVKEPNVPNRWCSNGSTLYKLGSIIDETSVANKDYVDTELSALKDKIFDVIARTYEEDIPTDSYVVPNNFDGHGLIDSVPCEVKSISGASKQFNQLVQEYGRTENGVETTWDNINKCFVSNTTDSSGMTTGGARFNTYIYCEDINHTYFISVEIVSNPDNLSLCVGTMNISDGYFANISSGKHYKIFKPTKKTSIGFANNTVGTVLKNVKIRVQLFDLTLMGLDSITSVDEFKAKYPLDYYAYDSGSIKSVSVSKIDSWGYNLFDGELEIGGLDSSNGTPFTNANNLRSKNFIKVIAGQTYTLSVSNFTNATALLVYGYDKNKTFIGNLYSTTITKPITQKIPSNCNYIKLRILNNSEYSSVPTDPQICFHNASVNLGYKPYIGKIGTITLPNGKIDLNGINDIKDKLEFVEQENGTYNAVLTRKIGVVDLGTLDWVKQGDGTSNVRFSCSNAIDNPNTSNDTIANILCTKYMSDTINHTYLHTNDKAIATSNKTVQVYDSYFDNLTAEQFKAAMSGVMLYYELATPTTEVIATGLTREQVAMAFEIGGTIINDNENTDYGVQATTTIDFVCKDWSI